MKSKTVIAALAATLALCLPAKADPITADATHTVEIDFTGLPLPFSFHPSVSLQFADSNLWEHNEVLHWQIFDAGTQDLLNEGSLVGTTNPLHGIQFVVTLNPTLSTPNLSIFISSEGDGSFDVASANLLNNGIDNLRYQGTLVDPSPVPAPIVGAGLPGLVTLLGSGWWLRRRRQAAVTA